ncbi:Snf2-ATP coupling, chromatin remodelling complex, partial [Rhizoctonia solani]
MLRSQISAWKYLLHRMPVPLEIQQAIQPQASTKESDQLTAPLGQLLENNTTSLIYPYNVYTNPTTWLATAKNLCAIVPSMTPLGLDPLALKAACKRFVKACIAQCIQELSVLPSTIGKPKPEVDKVPAEDNKDSAVIIHPSANAHGKLCALIELKGLQLCACQQALCCSVITHLQELTVCLNGILANCCTPL